QTLKMLGIPSSTYYDWYARWSDGGVAAAPEVPDAITVSALLYDVATGKAQEITPAASLGTIRAEASVSQTAARA
ncbi:hypothetical protein, partial [uncultured Ruegeria sp.]|uniref:hypothetical protein n=1 Tax=uncultured Ruegeria sp. TaxID=259304 RepID=UPI00260D538D